MTDDLVKRLREDAIDHRDVAGCCDCDPKDTRNWRHALNVEEAADRIEQLEREKASWKGAYDGAVLALTERNKELEDALRYIIDEWADEYETGGLENFCRAALGEKKDGD